MSASEQDVLAALREVTYPGFTRDIVAFGIVRELAVSADGRVRFKLVLGPGAPGVAERIEQAARAAVLRVAGVSAVEIQF
ncbi:MAG TPA: iron-sulfur cluster assembly protein, partial [Candidatus Polarisedimenticolaceae bacterium]|nr:iron-sulfur cluster assembly protein [Candidatus Polarisedimenticolaceae bacterium]